MTKKIKSTTTQSEIDAWVEKHGRGNVIQLTHMDRVCYVFDPSTDLQKWKLCVAARRKSIGHLVDAVLNNCWLGGDEQFKTDDALKLGIEEAVDEMIDVPDYTSKELDNGNHLVTIGDIQCEVRKATRMDIRYAEDRNRDNKPFDTQIFLLERVAVSDLAQLKKNTKAYISMLLAVGELRDAKRIELKKF